MTYEDRSWMVIARDLKGRPMLVDYELSRERADRLAAQYERRADVGATEVRCSR